MHPDRGAVTKHVAQQAGLAARSGHNDHDAPKPGCRDGQTGCGLAARSG